jgi:redox-sensitive bicupin YhaK (pirin superfamily)
MTNRQINTIINGQATSDGAGVKLKRIINQQHHSLFDPFLLLDEFGSDKAGDYIAGFPSHPHRGFETVTYMLAGAMLHRDHLGNEGHLRAGDVQWMSAARGIIHSEMPEQENGLLHGFQLWLNLPAAEKMNEPHYQDFPAADIPVIELANNSFIKLVAGNYANKSGIVKGVTTQPLYLDVVLTANQTVLIPISEAHTVLVYVYQGELVIDNKTIIAGQLAQLINGDSIELSSQDNNSRCLVLAALPLNEPIVQAGPFVMNTQQEIEQAFSDYRRGVLTKGVK